jgi:hypothetical protein
MRFFLALDPPYVPPCSVIVASIAIVPIKEYGDRTDEQASLRGVDLGQPSKEGEVVDVVT